MEEEGGGFAFGIGFGGEFGAVCFLELGAFGATDAEMGICIQELAS